MSGNRDRQNDEVEQRHKKKFRRGGGIALFLFALSGLAAAVSNPRKYAELIEDGAGHIDRMRPGFDVGNFTIIPREDPTHKKRCDGVNQAVHHGLANNQTQDTVSLLCSESMWRFVNENDVMRVSEETPCKVDVAPGTHDEQIAELNALNLVCKTLMGTFDAVVFYSVGFSMSALSLLYSLYHCKKAFWAAQPEEQRLLEGEGEPDSESLSYQNDGRAEGVPPSPSSL